LPILVYYLPSASISSLSSLLNHLNALSSLPSNAVTIHVTISFSHLSMGLPTYMSVSFSLLKASIQNELSTSRAAKYNSFSL
jgi:hypothetical protein